MAAGTVEAPLSAHPELVAGDRMVDGRYRLDQAAAGTGRWATVRAVDERLGRAVTVQLPPVTLCIESIRRYNGLDDSRLVRILDVDQTGSSSVLVTEAYSGASFAELLSDGLLTVESAIELVAEAAHAVAVVHAAGLAYGGLAPESICWTDSGLVKVLDVALATGCTEVADDVQALQLMLQSALPRDASSGLRSVVSTNLGTAEELAATLEPFRPFDAPLRRSLVSPEPVGAPHRMASRRVREVMAAGVPTVSEDTPVLEVAAILAECRYAAVPVVDAAGRVTGMISAADLAQWHFGTVSV